MFNSKIIKCYEIENHARAEKWFALLRKIVILKTKHIISFPSQSTNFIKVTFFKQKQPQKQAQDCSCTNLCLLYYGSESKFYVAGCASNQYGFLTIGLLTIIFMFSLKRRVQKKELYCNMATKAMRLLLSALHFGLSV